MTELQRATAVVLAAGEGKRLDSPVPKVLHRVAGRPLLAHVLAALEPLLLEQRIVVVSRKRDVVEESMQESGFGDAISYVVQEEPRGTADAVRLALQAADIATGTILVVNGSTPCIRSDTLANLLDEHARRNATATLLTARVPGSNPYGRIVRGADGNLERIIETRDASDDELAIDEVNVGVYVFDAEVISVLLPKIDRENAQGEYYLTDVVGLMASDRHLIATVSADPAEVIGIKDRSHLARADAVLRQRICDGWMARGVSIVDPNTTYIDATVEIGKDATIRPFTFLEGRTIVGDNAEIGPQSRIVDSRIGPAASVSFAVVRDSDIGPEASVGPFASLRAGTVLERGARAGTFVETKQTTIGENSKANHLAYLGDADIGRDVNIGAGSITCNWDGKEKHKTEIEDEAYIGSDTMLVAPVHVGKRAATGAGSVVKGDVPNDALAVGAPARILEGRGDKMGKKSAETDELPQRGEASSLATTPEGRDLQNANPEGEDSRQ